MAPTSWIGKGIHNWSSDMYLLKSVSLYPIAPKSLLFQSARVLISLLTHPSHIPLILWNSFDPFWCYSWCTSQFGCILWNERIRNAHSIKDMDNLWICGVIMVFCTVVFVSFLVIPNTWFSFWAACGGVHFHKPIYYSTQIPLCSRNDQPTAF